MPPPTIPTAGSPQQEVAKPAETKPNPAPGPEAPSAPADTSAPSPTPATPAPAPRVDDDDHIPDHPVAVRDFIFPFEQAGALPPPDPIHPILEDGGGHSVGECVGCIHAAASEHCCVCIEWLPVMSRAHAKFSHVHIVSVLSRALVGPAHTTGRHNRNTHPVSICNCACWKHAHEYALMLMAPELYMICKPCPFTAACMFHTCACVLHLFIRYQWSIATQAHPYAAGMALASRSH